MEITWKMAIRSIHPQVSFFLYLLRLGICIIDRDAETSARFSIPLLQVSLVGRIEDSTIVH